MDGSSKQERISAWRKKGLRMRKQEGMGDAQGRAAVEGGREEKTLGRKVEVEKGALPRFRPDFSTAREAAGLERRRGLGKKEREEEERWRLPLLGIRPLLQCSPISFYINPSAGFFCIFGPSLFFSFLNPRSFSAFL